MVAIQDSPRIRPVDAPVVSETMEVLIDGKLLTIPRRRREVNVYGEYVDQAGGPAGGQAVHVAQDAHVVHQVDVGQQELDGWPGLAGLSAEALVGLEGELLALRAAVAVGAPLQAFFQAEMGLPGLRSVSRGGPPPPLQSLPDPPLGNAHKVGGDCLAGSVFEVKCADGNWKWTWAPCGKWRCQPCRERRIADDLVPEVQANMVQAECEGLTLKFLTLTWQADDLGAQPTPEGAHRRKLDLQHLVQWVRRDKGEVFEYVRVPEIHKSGKVHDHLVVRMPFVRQQELSKKWKDFARGSFVVDIRAVYAKCPGCWPGPGAAEAVKARSRITPLPGTGWCANCGYRPHPVELERLIALGAAWEIGKYLGKAPVGKVTRSKGWVRPPELSGDGKLCKGCGDEHTVTYVGPRLEVEAAHPGLAEALAFRMAYYPPGGSPCQCWGEHVTWMESKGRADQGLGDLVGLARDGPG